MSIADTAAAPGHIVLLGSGETSPSMRHVYNWLFRQMDVPVNVSIVETPAGFQPNSNSVAGHIGAYLEKHLHNYRPHVSIIPARKRGTTFSPDDPQLLTPLYMADVILMGPGSPTYATRQLQDSVAWHTLRACHALGVTVILASAATLAASAHVMPVYEIYKVGEDLHWLPGLNLFGDFGSDLVFVSHWNNNGGGDVLDTSRCYLGQDRFRQLVEMLPPTPRGEAYTIVGIEENTALILDPATASCRVMGPGGVIMTRDGHETVFASGTTFDARELGAFHLPDYGTMIPREIWEYTCRAVGDAHAARTTQPKPSAAVLTLVEKRSTARQRKDWAASDQLRDEIAAAGWQVRDTPEGPVLEPFWLADSHGTEMEHVR